MDRRLWPTLGVVVLICSAATARPDLGFAVRLERPLQAGTKLALHVQGSSTRTITEIAEGRERTVEQNEYTISFDAESNIREVDVFGHPVCVDYFVASCEVVRAGVAVEARPSGAVLRAVRLGTETYFETEGRAVGPELSGALDLVAGLGRDGGLPGRVFDSMDRKQPGDEWSVDRGLAVEGLERRLGAPMPDGAVLGHAGLVDVRNHENQPCLLIRSQLSGQQRVELGGDAATDVSMTIQHQGLFPIDRRLPCLSDTWRTRTESYFRAGHGLPASPDGLRVVVTTVIQRVARPDLSPDGPIPGPALLAGDL